MGERERKAIELGILSIGREWSKGNCQCDPDVGMVPCHYCAEHSAILAGERLLIEIRWMMRDLETCRKLLRDFVEWSEPSGCGVHHVTVSDEWLSNANEAGGE